MKYSVIFKFIAVLLCAASLLGIVGSGLGILVMTSGELYNRTVEEMVEEQIQQQGADLARSIAGRYASENLGGLPMQLASERFPDHYYGVLNGVFSYSLKDSEGNVLLSEERIDTATAKKYTFPVSGQYMHLVSSMTHDEKYPPVPTELPSASGVSADGVYIYEDIPAEGISVDYFVVEFADGNYFDYQGGNTDSVFGTVFYAQDGTVVCLFQDRELFLPVDVAVERVFICANGVLVYEARSTGGTPVGYITGTTTGQGQMFRSEVVMPGAETETLPATVPEATEETVPETVAETVAQLLLAPEPTVPETVPFTPAKVTDNIPKDGLAEVTILEATFSDGRTLSHEDEFGLGRIRRKGDDVVFTSYEHWEAEAGTVTHILFLDEHGDILYEASHEDGVGKLTDKDSQISFRSDIPEPPVVETVPETTVPPTTVPETVPPTVPETEEAVTEPEVTEPETVPANTLPATVNGKALDEFDILNTEYYDHELDQRVYVQYVYTLMPEYTLELYLSEASLSYGEYYEILRLVREYRSYLLPMLGISILLFFVFGVYLVCAAGHKAKEEQIKAGGLNRIPLDLYLLTVGLGIPCLCVLITEGCGYLLRQDLLVGCACAVGAAFAACLLVVGFLFALVAQCKTPGGFWWRNTLCGHFMRLFFRFVAWLEKSGKEVFFPFLGRVFKKLWRFTSTSLVWAYRTTEKLLLWTGRKFGGFFSRLWSILHRFLCLLPLTWQWLLCGFMMFLLVAVIFATNGEEILTVLCIGACIALIVYGAHCFGTLLDKVKNMRKGDLDTKVDDKMMVGSFKEFAGELNELAGVVVVAAQKQLNSERMKSELITNVSHDIKTPLTSIINYVDLLQKPHTEAEGEQYLEVLSRQSQQLKKLLEDLMDMSKASTGNMTVEITRLDAVEAVNQALGEFADKLEKAQLSPVFRHPEEAMPILADGRLLWRVLSNLLGNVVKYAMPGTRVYLDLMRLEGQVVFSIKNISRDELSMDATELMERFVRGDDSRNTEGSGLGLNIAKSLVELQKGQMQLLVDGDLFKVTLIFPGAK